MVIGENREKDLAQLESLVKREKLAGQIVHLFYHHLRSAYPLEFIYLARKHNKSNAGHQYYIQQAKEQINRAYSKMNNYLIIPPVALNDTYFMESNIDSNGKFDRIKQALKIFDLEDELMIKYAEE